MFHCLVHAWRLRHAFRTIHSDGLLSSSRLPYHPLRWLAFVLPEVNRASLGLALVCGLLAFCRAAAELLAAANGGGRWPWGSSELYHALLVAVRPQPHLFQPHLAFSRTVACLVSAGILMSFVSWITRPRSATGPLADAGAATNCAVEWTASGLANFNSLAFTAFTALLSCAAFGERPASSSLVVLAGFAAARLGRIHKFGGAAGISTLLRYAALAGPAVVHLAVAWLSASRTGRAARIGAGGAPIRFNDAFTSFALAASALVAMLVAKVARDRAYAILL